MSYRITWLAFTVGAILGCSSREPPMVRRPAPDELVTVVAEPKYYVSGTSTPLEREMKLFEEPDPKRIWHVDGIVLKIINPPEYAGQIITMHHDGLLASGDPYKLWQVGARYEFAIARDEIGKLTFAPCSLHGTRKVIPK